MANTTNFGWETPDDTDLVKDGAAAMRTLGNSIDASFVDLKGGTTGQILAKNSNTDLDFIWSSDATGIQATIFDAKGDIIAATAADTAARLAVGTNGQYLSADSTAATGLKWVTPTAAGENWTQVATGSLTGASISLTSLSTYDKYLLLMYDISFTNTDTLNIQFNSSSSDYRTLGFQRGNAVNSTSQAAIVPIDATTVGQCALRISGALSTTGGKFYDLMGAATQATAGGAAQRGYWANNNAITSIQIKSATDTFDGGTYILYGAN
jgi:hypothetical protein